MEDDALLTEFNLTYRLATTITGYSTVDAKQTQVSKTVNYHNHSTEIVNVVERSGLHFRLLPSDVCTGRFIVTITYMVTARAHIDPTHDISEELLSKKKNISAEEEALLSPVEHARKSHNHGRGGRSHTFTVEYTYSLTDLLRNTVKGLYLDETDLVVTVGDFTEDSPRHPFSTEGRRRELICTMSYQHTQRSMYHVVRLVCNSGEFTGQYMNIAGDICFVPSIKSPTEQNGVYIYTGQEVHSVVRPKIEYYTYEEARKKFGMYETRELCENVQKMLTAEHELRMSELKVQLEETKMNAEQQKQKYEAESLKRKQEHEEYKEQLEKEAARRKDEYERRSVVRKDDSETWKMTTVVVGSALAIGGLIFKAMK
jgi:hypothetical protein